MSSERNTPIVDQDAATIHPRPAGPHHKPGHKSSEAVGNPFPDKSQDADRHNKVRHEDSQK